jgi:hypothetical protein
VIAALSLSFPLEGAAEPVSAFPQGCNALVIFDEHCVPAVCAMILGDSANIAQLAMKTTPTARNFNLDLRTNMFCTLMDFTLED